MHRRTAGVGPGIALLPLRLFLGATFVYAGVQKLSDPGFLHAGAPTYIGTQLTGFAHGSPGGFILRAFAIPHPIFAGVAVSLVEIAIGLCAFSGLLTRYAAAGGLALNLLLFGTASWHTTPYFLGPDIVFVFAWLPFVLAGAEGQPALAEAETDEFGHPRLGGIGHWLQEEIESRTGFETRATVLGHVQRGGTPSAFDRVLATRLGLAAIDAVHEGHWGTMVALRGTRIEQVPLADAVAELRTVPLQDYEAFSPLFG